ncbi:MAG TPA: pyruvate, phosphate dikinase [Armatimonadota bacterium]|nr:pyruvate, phosphate dikinase [Armatimonadota bacterium]
MSDKKRVYLFREGNAAMRDLLGGKGANLCEMTNIGLPVPPGFVITTEACNEYTKLGRLPDGLWEDVLAALADLERDMAKKFGDPSNPLLVSVRSGAKFSMPGMMDTVLNLGLNDETLHALIKLTGNERFGYDAYRRFVMMFSDIVLSGDYPRLKKEHFEKIFSALKRELGAKVDTDVDAEGLKTLVGQFKAYFEEVTGRDFPTDPMEQLRLAIIAVFKSWNNERAITYRNKERIPHDLGTAVSIQTMVFGNMGDDSGTGVAFTRDPATGENKLFGEFLKNAQGEDVVAGVRTPESIEELEREFPAIHDQFAEIADKLEKHYREVQDIEFTIENGRLFILQCRAGKRTGVAAVKIAVDMVNEGLLTKEEALIRVPPEALEQLLNPRIKSTGGLKPIAKGLNAGPGGASGHVALDSKTAIKMAEAGQKVILVREETNPDDLGGMLASVGVLTQRGGRTSHAALVARQYGIPTICACSALRIDEHARQVKAGGVVVKEGDVITIDGTLGEVYNAALETEPATVTGDFGTFMAWADEYRRLGVRANADTAEQAEEAVKLGAEGIGLARTEHMFLGSERVPLVRDMILAEDEPTREAALAKLLPLQRADFVGIFKAMGGRPVTIRLIDPPLHEFLPPLDELLVEVTELRCRNGDPAALKEKEALLKKVQEMHEVNPMLGLRGCRLSIYFPGIVNMQVAAMIGAACELKKAGIDAHLEIMIPLIGAVSELTYLKAQLDEVARKTMAEEGVEVDYAFGTMIEIPRAALTADEIAKEAAFFSFGTNDLTQMGYGISRDDARFLPVYIEKGIFKADPTETIDVKGIGRMMKICVDDAKAVNPNIKLGICGEHGGEPESVKFCHKIGLTYVSCSPRRIPVARLAAAQAAIEEKGATEQRDK